MNVRGVLISCALLGASLATAPSAAAHRLDEYLQATLLSVDQDHVDLEIGLTAGVALASQIFSWIDTNGDHAISSAEGDAYARQMLHSVTLSVDGKSVPVALVDASFPSLGEMSLGMGTIRLRATAKIPTTGAGFHRVSFLNTHHPESSVYLVNTLVPANPRIRIGDQRRDRAQRGLTLDYSVMSGAPPVWGFPVLAGLAGLVLVGRWVFAARSFLRVRPAGAEPAP